MTIRYRTGVDARTGKPLSGFAHCAQSVDDIVTTLLTERVLLLDYGLNPTRRLGRNISPALAAQLYRDAIAAIHKWEPEFRITTLQLVGVDRTGMLALRIDGRYFPEGRYGNYDIVEMQSVSVALASLVAREAA